MVVISGGLVWLAFILVIVGLKLVLTHVGLALKAKSQTYNIFSELGPCNLSLRSMFWDVLRHKTCTFIKTDLRSIKL